MKDRLNVNARLQIAKGKFREYEGRLKQLEGRLTVIQGRAQQTTGRARVRLQRLERDVRSTIDATLARVDGLMKAVEPRVRRSLAQTKALERGVRAGIRAGAAAYRRSRPK
jgi:hypothetical protein